MRQYFWRRSPLKLPLSKVRKLAQTFLRDLEENRFDRKVAKQIAEELKWLIGQYNQVAESLRWESERVADFEHRRDLRQVAYNKEWEITALAFRIALKVHNIDADAMLRKYKDEARDFLEQRYVEYRQKLPEVEFLDHSDVRTDKEN